MITAKEARRQMKILSPGLLDKIYFGIEKASKEGDNSIGFLFRNNVELEDLFRVRDDLVELGYTITINSEATYSKVTGVKKLYQLKVKW